MFSRPEHSNPTYVLVWAAPAQTDLTLSVPAGDVRAMRPFGKPLGLRSSGGRSSTSCGHRNAASKARKGGHWLRRGDLSGDSTEPAGGIRSPGRGGLAE